MYRWYKIEKSECEIENEQISAFFMFSMYSRKLKIKVWK